MFCFKKLLLAVVLLLCSTVASAHDFEMGGIYYNIISSSDLTVEVTYKGSSYNEYSNEYIGAIVIPATVIYNSETYSVTTIGDYAFYGCTEVTSITIPGSVAKIGSKAFSCTNSLAGQKILCLGNSITEFKGYDKKRYSDHIAELTGATVYNGGIGGTGMSRRTDVPADGAFTKNSQAYAGLDLPSIAESLNSGDFSLPQVAAEWLVSDDNPSKTTDDNRAIVEGLKNVDLSSIDIVTIFIGTNDIGKQLGELGESIKVTDRNPYPYANVSRGFNRVISQLLLKNPNLKIYYFSPMPRYFGSSLDEWDETKWCDNYTVSAGYSFPDLVDHLISLAQYYKIPVCDMYRTLGINKDNIFEYAPDGTHPYYGYKLIAERMVSFINEENNYKGLADIYFASNIQIDANTVPSIVSTHLVLNDDDSLGFCATNANTYVDASYTRTISEGKYGTIILPFTPDAASLKNYAFYTLKEAGDGYIKFEEVATPVANTPYLYALREGGKNVAITGGETTIVAEINNYSVGGWEFVGSFTKQTIDCTDGNYYAYSAARNEINRITKTLTVSPFRAYLKSTAAQNSNLRVFISGTTGVTEISPDDIEGFNNGAIYDLGGRPVNEPVKGSVYIVDGKKVVL